MKKLLLMAIPAVVLFSSCNEVFSKRVKGNGNLTTKSRPAGDFHGVDVSGNIDVVVKQESTASINVEADENLQEYIEVIVQNNTVRIRSRDGYNLQSRNQIVVHVSGPSLNKFSASGACSIKGQDVITSSETMNIDLSGSCDVDLNLEAPKIDAGASGASTIKIKGKTRDLDVDGSGSTDVKCFSLVAENVHIDISGAGDAEVNASASITGSISGAGNLNYRGTARTDVSTSGASSIKKID